MVGPFQLSYRHDVNTIYLKAHEARRAMATRPGDIVDLSVHSPRYIQVYTAIRDWIYQGAYRPGSQLPTEGELCRLFGVSRITTRKAVDMLVDERLVVRQPGRGTFVVEDLADAPVVADMEQLLLK